MTQRDSYARASLDRRRFAVSNTRYGAAVAIVSRRGFGDGISYFGLWPRVTGAMRRRVYYYTLFAGGRSVNATTWWRPPGVKR